MATHHAELQAWNKKLEGIAESLTQKIADNWKVVDKEIRTDQSQNIDRLEKSVFNMQHQQNQTAEAINKLVMSLNSQQVDQAVEERRVKLEQEMTGVIHQFGHTLKSLGEQTEALQSKLSLHLNSTSDQLGTHLNQVQEELASLNQTLENLQDKQIIIEDNSGEEPDPKKEKGCLSNAEISSPTRFC